MAVDYTQYTIYKSADGYPDYTTAPQKYLTHSDVGIVTEFSYKYDIRIYNIPFPVNPSSKALVIDLLGMIKTITIEGQRIDTVANLKTFLQYIKGLEAGTTDNATSRGLLTSHQMTDNLKFHNAFHNNTGVGTVNTNDADINAVVTGFEYSYEGGVPTRINYTLTLMETFNYT